MKSRVRPPSLVSMWMLDVFCCALGCVTLLWLLNTRQAKMVAVDLASQKAQLAESREKLDQSQQRLTTASQQELLLQERIRLLEAEGERLRISLLESGNTIAALSAILDGSEKRELGLAANIVDLKTEQKRLTGLLSDEKALTATRTRERDSIQAQLLATRTELASLRTEMAAMQAKLTASEKAYATATLQIRDLLAMNEKSDAKTKTQTDDMARLLRQIAGLERKLQASSETTEDYRKNIIDLQGQIKSMDVQLKQAKADEETRFAGIAMSGRSVVFLVDVSGSMMMRDKETDDLTKWPIVVETIVKVMRSIPQMEQFQLVLFSDQVQHPLGQRGRWIRFEGNTTLDLVKRTLMNFTPKGDTNLYDGFEAAFGMRDQGMDTLYLFSDGLPTSGPGLTIAQQALGTNLPEAEKSDILARYVRQKMQQSWNGFRANAPRVRINSIGFFFENPAVGAFLWALSRENDGSFVGMSKP
ncbi:vWA domain-containing protein [Tuwongella immobilis]|uniref:VWFA domain-containing protein n=1 Tax=Tuwongella immobilis TaxID=692036 RepID=A0A6C2YRS8_9BACT|nr:vWA domain-containing protein [Tuwongella immobilis]VIP04061.1 Uncharacterized protein OS=Gammaproteobacteria bacterium MOLA455 GN=U062_00813 PE=4 SV=1: VWA_2 [Tuwongella immobilis]VTS05489.1 Uncharacterized protein OS=Gammaproteobacteria bacterium MOLA455 GN=U062_00813 PE=4 SV=1: VWA_2 [Tuwongella immobilis]